MAGLFSFLIGNASTVCCVSDLFSPNIA